MGTIMSRRRKDGTTGYTAVIRIKKGGKVIRTETQTFDRKQAAGAWLKKRETELAQPGALVRGDDPALAAVIDRYISESKREMGRTKAQVLRAIKRYDVAGLQCSEIGSEEISAFANELAKGPRARDRAELSIAPERRVRRGAPAVGIPT
jgi:hypothetical protein